MAVCFYDGEVFSIGKDELDRSQLLMFFLNGHREETVIVNDGQGRYYGFISYYSLLNAVNTKDAIIKEKIYLKEIYSKIENMHLRYPYVNFFPVFGKNDVLIYLAKDDPTQMTLWEKLIFLEQNFQELDHGIWAEVPHIHIRGISEVLYNLVLFLKHNDLPFSVEEESWKEFGIDCLTGSGNWHPDQIAGPDGHFIEELYNKLWERNQLPEWNAQRWKAFCQDLKSRNRPIVFCGCEGGISEKVYDALLEEGIVPSAVLSSCTYQAMFGEKVNDMSAIEKPLYCVAGTLGQARAALTLEKVLRRESGYCGNIYLLSEVGYCVTDCMLQNLIYHCCKVVLMGNERLCHLFAEGYLMSRGMEVTYLVDVDSASKRILTDCSILWFYLDFPFAGEEQFRKCWSSCLEKGIYLSRYFMDHYGFCKRISFDGLTSEERIVVECLRVIEERVEVSDWQKPISNIKQRILFFSSEYSYFWDNVEPLFKHYAKMDNVECTVLLERASSFLSGWTGMNNFVKMMDNMRRVREEGGKVCWYYDCNQYRKYDVAFFCCGYSEYRIESMKKGFCKMIVSLQTTPFYAHIYSNAGEFEKVFGRKNFETVDYLVTSDYLGEWLVRREDAWKQKILPFGYPRMDHLYVGLHNAEIPDAWKQKVAGKTVILFSVMFLEWMRYCLDYGKVGQEVIVIYRPHPLALDDDSERLCIEKLEQEGNVIIDRNPSYVASFQISNALITTPYSSLVANYLFTGKPVLISENGRKPLEDYSKEAWYQASYVAMRKEDGMEFVDMIMDNRDDEELEKAPYRKMMKKNYDGKVCERIESFVSGKL